MDRDERECAREDAWDEGKEDEDQRLRKGKNTQYYQHFVREGKVGQRGESEGERVGGREGEKRTVIRDRN